LASPAYCYGARTYVMSMAGTGMLKIIVLEKSDADGADDDTALTTYCENVLERFRPKLYDSNWRR